MIKPILSPLPKIAIALSCLVSFSFQASSPAWAGDPFRNSDQNPRNIGEKTEKAFEAVFRYCNYPEAELYINQAEESENYDPIVPALKGALAYLYQDMESLQNYALKTLELAENIKGTDQVRGHLYLAVGHFLEGTYIYETDNPLAAIPKVQKVFEHMDKAEDAHAEDPELNLIKGYMELTLALYLPFSSPEQAITKLENNAAPNYLVYRGIALAYRDLDKLDEALDFADRALNLTPNNPEALYLKGQIIRKQGLQGNHLSLLQTALPYLRDALEYQDQLPEFILKPLTRETRNTCNQIKESIPETECHI